jgi:cyclin-A
MYNVAPFALPAAPRCPAPYGYASADAAEREVLLGSIVFGRMPSAEFPALTTQDIKRPVQVVAPTRGCFAAPDRVAAIHEDDDAPTTPVAVLKAPTISYGDDINNSSVINEDAKKKTTDHDKMKEDPSWEYDDSIDALLRKMERNPAERPSEDYHWTTQEGCRMMMGDRAELVGWMYDFAKFHGVAPGALHRAVNYVDRFMSSNPIIGGRPNLLGGAAVFTAAKYEDSRTLWVLDADDVAEELGCTRHDVLAAERALVAALGYRLSGPTAYTFVDHFTRYDGQDGEAVRSLAHQLADVTLLDYRCAPFLPSAVAAAAILLARRVVIDCAVPWSEELIKMTGYTIQDLIDIIDAIYDMHELEGRWPGCALMLADRTYSLPPR